MATKLKKGRILRYAVLFLSVVSLSAAVLTFSGGTADLYPLSWNLLKQYLLVILGIVLSVFSGRFFEIKRKRISFEITLLIFGIYCTALICYFDIVVYAPKVVDNNFVIPDAFAGNKAFIYLPLFLVCVSLLVNFIERFCCAVHMEGFAENCLTVRFLRFITTGKGIKKIITIYLMISAFFGILISTILSLAFMDTLSRIEAPFSVIIVCFASTAFSIAVFLIFTMRKKSALSDIETIFGGIDNLYESKPSENNAVSEKSLFYKTSEKLAHIDEITRESIQKGIASEKMKVELITNISHDLKTPLTSIIGYGELLEKDDLPEHLAEKIRKLNYKSKYLMELVENVFELSKAASGNAEINKSKLDLRKLLEQCAGELYDRSLETGTEIILKTGKRELMAETDGIKLHRIFQNLLDNALKYSLRGTRIYIEADAANGEAEIEIINTSSYKMEFNPENITERFERGDKSRSGEGNGLGLAIAKTYAEALGGSFEIKIKGDQFSALVKLPLITTEN